MLIYYTKKAILYVGYLHTGLIVSAIGLFCSRSRLRKIGRICFGLIGKLLGISYELRGGAWINSDTAYVVISNHQHAIDCIAMMEVYDKINNLVVVAKHSLKWMGPFGLALQFIGTVFVRPGHLEESLTDLSYLVKTARANGTSIYMFPEGTRHLVAEDGNKMLPFKKGAFHVAIEGNFPILPVVISNYHFIDHKEKMFRSSKVIVEVLKPINTEGVSKDNINEFIDGIRNQMVTVFEKDKEKLL